MKLETRYRIVRDRYLGYEAQFRPWWSPFWCQCFGLNTEPSVERSMRIIHKHKTRVVVSNKEIATMQIISNLEKEKD